ncbi:hypothetical protein [Pseudomonas abietaniphila]|uniref:hypothetical protein n=1 Tax=Pseudomonas abietaniphila TaxID=89065 RepID=UPI00115FF960|nr:hypothetical protein [Pseudomonas abietaniphila]
MISLIGSPDSLVDIDLGSGTILHDLSIDRGVENLSFCQTFLTSLQVFWNGGVNFENQPLSSTLHVMRSVLRLMSAQ